MNTRNEVIRNSKGEILEYPYIHENEKGYEDVRLMYYNQVQPESKKSNKHKFLRCIDIATSILKFIHDLC